MWRLGRKTKTNQQKSVNPDSRWIDSGYVQWRMKKGLNTLSEIHLIGGKDFWFSSRRFEHRETLTVFSWWILIFTSFYKLTVWVWFDRTGPKPLFFCFWNQLTVRIGSLSTFNLSRPVGRRQMEGFPGTWLHSSSLRLFGFCERRNHDASLTLWVFILVTCRNISPLNMVSCWGWVENLNTFLFINGVITL